MSIDSIHDAVLCAERRGRTPARSIDAAIVKKPAYGRDCRSPNGIYRPKFAALPYGKSDCYRRAIFAETLLQISAYLCGGLIATGLPVAVRCCCSVLSVATSLISLVIATD